MLRNYLVATGAVVFSQPAHSPKQAMLLVKERLRAAYFAVPNRHDPTRLSRALVEAFAAGKLNFVVMDGKRTRLLCGEHQGVYQRQVNRTLADSLRHLIPDSVEMARRNRLRERFPAASRIDSAPLGNRPVHTTVIQAILEEQLYA